MYIVPPPPPTRLRLFIKVSYSTEQKDMTIWVRALHLFLIVEYMHSIIYWHSEHDKNRYLSKHVGTTSFVIRVYQKTCNSEATLTKKNRSFCMSTWQPILISKKWRQFPFGIGMVVRLLSKHSRNLRHHIRAMWWLRQNVPSSTISKYPQSQRIPEVSHYRKTRPALKETNSCIGRTLCHLWYRENLLLCIFWKFPRNVLTQRVATSWRMLLTVAPRRVIAADHSSASTETAETGLCTGRRAWRSTSPCPAPSAAWGVPPFGAACCPTETGSSELSEIYEITDVKL